MPFVLFITWLVAITVIYILWYLCKLIYAIPPILIPIQSYMQRNVTM